jgi:predicted dehydrogenase
MSTELKIGIIGLDTSHSPAFTKLLNDTKDPQHVPGGRVVVAFPGGSPDFELSFSRVGKFTQEVRDLGVQIVDTPEAVAEQSDVIMLESADGRVHLSQFKRIVSYKKPTFIDKPFTIDSREAREIVELAEKKGVPIMSCSPMRYATKLVEAVADTSGGKITGIDCYGPLKLQPTQTGYFWYVIHTAEILYAALGVGCVEVTVQANEKGDVIIGTWKDGRKGIIRANGRENNFFGGVVHRETNSKVFDVSGAYASSVKQVVKMLQTKTSPVSSEEMIEVIRFIEAANEAKITGKTVEMHEDSFASTRLAC